MGAVTFNYQVWQARYPEFSGVAAPLAQAFFDEATLYCANKIGPVPTVATLAVLLNQLTAHIAQLNAPSTGSGTGPTPVGRLASATEGSVSASFENNYAPGTAQWFQQTQYGAAFWQATLSYRLFRYRSPTFRCGPASRGQTPWLYPNGS